MRKVLYSFFVILAILLLEACAPLHFTPLPTLEERQFIRERTIESYIRKKIPIGDRYESFGFGPITVNKPESFVRLDSLFTVKAEMRERNALREIKQSGIEDAIEQQRAIARQDEDQLTYEMEHIYLRNKMDSIYVHHDFFLLNNKDSILIHNPFYNYRLPAKYKNLWMKYLFELHFLTDFDYGISSAEQAFLRFLKEREQELIRTTELNSFMKHAMELMEMAAAVNSVDLVVLAKFVAINEIRRTTAKPDRVKFSALRVNENENGDVINYEIFAEWYDGNTSTTKRNSKFRFDPYLQLIP